MARRLEALSGIDHQPCSRLNKKVVPFSLNHLPDTHKDCFFRSSVKIAT